MALSDGTLTRIDWGGTPDNSVTIADAANDTSNEWSWAGGAAYGLVFVLCDITVPGSAGNPMYAGLLHSPGVLDASGDDWGIVDKFALHNAQQADAYEGDLQVLRLIVPRPLGKSKLVIYNDSGASATFWAKYQEKLT